MGQVVQPYVVHIEGQAFGRVYDLDAAHIEPLAADLAGLYAPELVVHQVGLGLGRGCRHLAEGLYEIFEVLGTVLDRVPVRIGIGLVRAQVDLLLCKQAVAVDIALVGEVMGFVLRKEHPLELGQVDAAVMNRTHIGQAAMLQIVEGDHRKLHLQAALGIEDVDVSHIDVLRADVAGLPPVRVLKELVWLVGLRCLGKGRHEAAQDMGEVNTVRQRVPRRVCVFPVITREDLLRMGEVVAVMIVGDTQPVGVVAPGRAGKEHNGRKPGRRRHCGALERVEKRHDSGFAFRTEEPLSRSGLAEDAEALSVYIPVIAQKRRRHLASWACPVKEYALVFRADPVPGVWMPDELLHAT